MKELVCIVCPKGCRLHVDEENDYAVTGNGCPRGAVYGHNEIKNPTRVLTSTVRLDGGLYRRCRRCLSHLFFLCQQIFAHRDNRLPH